MRHTVVAFCYGVALVVGGKTQGAVDEAPRALSGGALL